MYSVFWLLKYDIGIKFAGRNCVIFGLIATGAQGRRRECVQENIFLIPYL
jgi:hypothetical protein